MLLVDWQGTWHSVRISASPSCSQCADWLSAVDLITLRLLAVTLRWEADASKPGGSICMSGRAWTVHASKASVANVYANIPVPGKASSQHCGTSVRHAAEFIRGGPSACATAATVFHILLCGAGIHQPDQMRQHVTYHSSGGFPASTPFALNATLMEKIQRWRLIWLEDKAAAGKFDGLPLKPVVKQV